MLAFFVSLILFSSININDFVLIDKLEYVGRVHEDADGADGCNEEEEPELGPVHNHGHKLPVFPNLKQGKRLSQQGKYFKDDVTFWGWVRQLAYEKVRESVAYRGTPALNNLLYPFSS